MVWRIDHKKFFYAMLMLLRVTDRTERVTGHASRHLFASLCVSYVLSFSVLCLCKRRVAESRKSGESGAESKDI
jgi:hypothetical protein